MGVTIGEFWDSQKRFYYQFPSNVDFKIRSSVGIRFSDDYIVPFLTKEKALELLEKYGGLIFTKDFLGM
jgi:hypothetical protein